MKQTSTKPYNPPKDVKGSRIDEIVEEFRKSVFALFEFEDIRNTHLANLITNNFEHFMNQALNDYTQSIIEMVEGMKWIDDDDGGSMTANMGYNQALDDIKKELNK